MTALVSALIMAALPSAATGQQAHVGGPGLPWHTIPAAREGGAVTVKLSPGDTAGGRALVVLAKPDWMVLDDGTPPVLRSLTVDEQAVEAGEELQISADKAGPAVRVVVADDANPVDPGSVALTLNGQRFAAKATEKADGGLAASFDLSSLGAGAYEGTLEARDMGPLANALRVPLSLTVNGILRQPDGQTVTITRSRYEYVIGGAGKGQGFLRLGETGAAAFLSTEVGGKFVYARNIVAIEDIDGGRGVRLKADVVGIDNQDFGQIAELEFDATTIPDFPGLLLTSRARNLDADTAVYCFWGWLPGNGFVTTAGEQAWSMTYRDIGKVGWVFLPPTKPDARGIGMISALPFGESRFGTLLLYTDPQKIPTPRGEAVEMKLAFMQADIAEAVADAYETLQASGWLAGP